jgi:cation-transporting ATPase 13A3/4/5
MQNFTENIIHLSANSLKYQYSHEKDSENFPSYDLIKPKANGAFESTNSLIYFENKKVRYIWDTEKREFVKVRGLDKDVSCSYFYQQKGLSLEDQNKRYFQIFNTNNICIYTVYDFENNNQITGAYFMVTTLL